jgi:aminoglycoside phosphotransferase (APT) family kinase protein
MITASTAKTKKVDVAFGMATQAWRDVCRSAGREPTAPAAVVPLKCQRPGRKSGAYRLHGAGEDGSAVIAKRCTRATARVEREVYERLLPRIDVPALRYYGYLEEPDGDFCWLFLEDAGEDKLVEADRELAARWLARLHAGAAALADRSSLPDCGPDCYLAHLRIGREIIGDVLPRLAPSDDQRNALERLQRDLQELESRWESVCTACERAPRTLVHGDFARKNLRVRATPAGRDLVALDWETAGWGPPAADLPCAPIRDRSKRPPGTTDRPRNWDGTVSLEEYAACSGGQWDGPRRRDLERLARVGTVFRVVASVRWAAEQTMAGGAPRGVQRLCWYAGLLPRALADLEC